MTPDEAIADVGLAAAWDDPERERLSAELAAVTEALASARLELQDVKARLAAFTRFHDRLLAPLYAELDDVQAQIAELLAGRSGSPDDREDASAARARARKSADTAAETMAGDDTAGETMSADAPPRPRPSDLVRALFRTLIKLCHPDLAVSEADRMRREEFTARVNAAYAANDAARLEELAREWQAGASTTAQRQHEVSELRTAIETARRQLAEVLAEISRLTTTGLGELLFGADDPHAAVQRIADRVRAEIRRQRDVLLGMRNRP